MRNPVKIKIEIKNRDKVQAVPVLLKNYYVTLPSDAKLGFVGVLGLLESSSFAFSRSMRPTR